MGSDNSNPYAGTVYGPNGPFPQYQPIQTTGDQMYYPNDPSGVSPIRSGGQLPPTFPMGSLTQGMTNIDSLYNGVGQVAPSYYGNAQTQVSGAGDQALQQMSGIYNQGMATQQGATYNALPQNQNFYNNAMDQQGTLGQGAQQQIQGLENQNLGQVNNLLNNYDKSFIDQLGPNGKMGQQLMGEFNNYGITPQSGAFQSALGNTMGQLGAQNALTLGQQALQPGINAQYGDLNSVLGSQLGTAQQAASSNSGMLGQGLGAQLSTAQEGAKQGGTLANLQGIQQMQLGQDSALAPLNYQNQALAQKSNLVNEMTQAPIDYWNNTNNQNYAQQIQGQNQAAQNSAASNAQNAQLASTAMTVAALAAK